MESAVKHCKQQHAPPPVRGAAAGDAASDNRDSEGDVGEPVGSRGEEMEVDAPALAHAPPPLPAPALSEPDSDNERYSLQSLRDVVHDFARDHACELEHLAAAEDDTHITAERFQEWLVDHGLDSPWPRLRWPHSPKSDSRCTDCTRAT